MKWDTSYSNISIAQAEKRLGFQIQSLKRMPVYKMLRSADDGESPNAALKTKKKVYKQIVQYLETEGYPMEGDPNFNINRPVYATTSPAPCDFIRKTGPAAVQLQETITTGGETGGTEDLPRRTRLRWIVKSSSS